MPKTTTPDFISTETHQTNKIKKKKKKTPKRLKVVSLDSLRSTNVNKSAVAWEQSQRNSQRKLRKPAHLFLSCKRKGPAIDFATPQIDEESEEDEEKEEINEENNEENNEEINESDDNNNDEEVVDDEF